MTEAGQSVLVETLDTAGRWSVVAVDDRTYAWKSPPRTLPTGALQAVTKVHDSREAVRTLVTGPRNRRTENRVDAVPILGPDETVYGVDLWIGPDDDVPTHHRPVGAFTFDVDDRVIRISDATYAACGIRTTRERSLWTTPEALRLVDPLDGAMSLITTMISSRPDDRCEGVVALRPDSPVRAVHLVARNGPVPRDRVWRGLIRDVTDTTPAPLPSIESAAIAHLRDHDATKHLALMDVAQSRVIRWITDPVPDIRWQGMFDNHSSLHPDDVPRLLESAAKVVADGITNPSIDGLRLRRVDHGWTIVSATGTVLDYPEQPKLALVEWMVTGYSDKPDPDPPPS